jgi:hypothetical protein
VAMAADTRTATWDLRQGGVVPANGPRPERPVRGIQGGSSDGWDDYDMAATTTENGLLRPCCKTEVG